MSADPWVGAAEYEAYIGRWSRPVGNAFLDWLSIAPHRRWLDVGCGTGALSGTILQRADPLSVVGVDPSADFVELARMQTADPRARFAVAPADRLPLDAASADVIVRGLVLNFIPDLEAALAELRRVGVAGATIAGYVWDLAGRMDIIRTFWDSAIALDPAAAEKDEGARFSLCAPEPLREAFEGAGFSGVAVRSIDVPTVFRDSMTTGRRSWAGSVRRRPTSTGSMTPLGRRSASGCRRPFRRSRTGRSISSRGPGRCEVATPERHGAHHTGRSHGIGSGANLDGRIGVGDDGRQQSSTAGGSPMSQPASFLRRGLRRPGTVVAAMAVLLAFGASGVAASGPGKSTEVLDAQGIVHARGQAHVARPRSSPNLLFHGGQILTASVVRSIFWGSSWSTSAGDKISGLDSFYSTIGGSSYINTNTEYSGTNGTVGTGVTSKGHLIDLSAAPSRAPSTSTVLAEVARMITNPVANGYYPVYVDQPRGSAGYCAWHSSGTVAGVPVQFGFFFKLDGDPGCDPGDTSTTHSQGLAALANVSGHELSETVTDPRNGGWYDTSGAENADKCAWTFSGLVTLKSSGQWMIQGNWSNAAYNTRSGYDGAGCIQTR